MSETTHSADKAGLREAAAIGWDAAVAALKYEDGTPVGVVTMVNPYRVAPPDHQSCPVPHDEHDCATCTACIHNGRKCCGCYDGACCQDPRFRSSKADA